MKKYQDYKERRFTNSEIQKAKDYPVINLLKHYNLLVNFNKKDFKILNPFTDENTASFKVDVKLNRFHDFTGSTNINSTIDFVMKREKLIFADAVRKILTFSCDSANVGNWKKDTQKPTNEQPSPKPSDLKIITDNKKLTALRFYYLQKERCINPKLAKLHGLKYLEADNFYYIGIENDKGGFELKNKFISKKTIGQKAITTFINPIKTNDFTVFEAFLDYFSFLELNKIKQLKTNVIILHGTGQVREAIFKIRAFKKGKVFIALDNDDAGFKAANEFKSEFKDRITNLAKYYSKFKDVNECLQSIY